MPVPGMVERVRGERGRGVDTRARVRSQSSQSEEPGLGFGLLVRNHHFTVRTILFFITHWGRTCIMFLTTKRICFKTLFDETHCLREPCEEIREYTPG